MAEDLLQMGLEGERPWGALIKVLVTTKLKLTKQGQERTLIRFTLLADGTIKPGSMNSVFKPLRDGKK